MPCSSGQTVSFGSFGGANAAAACNAYGASFAGSGAEFGYLSGNTCTPWNAETGAAGPAVTEQACTFGQDISTVQASGVGYVSAAAVAVLTVVSALLLFRAANWGAARFRRLFRSRGN